jgi:hypothetical protein
MSDEIVNIRQYMNELKNVVGNNTYAYYSLPKHLKLINFHLKAIYRGYIKTVEYGGSSKPTTWIIVRC